MTGTFVALAAVTAALLACYTLPALALDRLAHQGSDRAHAWVFVAPLIALVGLLVIAPMVRTAYLSFFDKTGSTFVGLDNWRWATTSETAVNALRNNGFWLVGVTTLTMTIGFFVAIGSELYRRPSLVRAAVFAPMAISAVGATIVWQLVYAFKPEGARQTGLLNALITEFGGSPRAWLVKAPSNTWFLIWIMIWLWTGFATVVYAAALRTIPGEMIEAAEIDGASPAQIVRRIVLPSIKGTTGVIFVATIVTVLKVFDIVRVATNGQFETNVIANEMVKQAINKRDTGRASALALLLLLLMLPFLLFSVWRSRRRSAA